MPIAVYIYIYRCKTKKIYPFPHPHQNYKKEQAPNFDCLVQTSDSNNVRAVCYNSD